MPTFESSPILTTEPEWTDAPFGGWEYEANPVDIGFGAGAVARTQEATARTWDLGFTLRTSGDILALEAFLDQVQGAWGVFWVPAPVLLARIVAVVSTTQIKVRKSGSPGWWNTHPRRELWIQSAAEWGTDAGQCCRITAAVVDGDEEKWTLDRAVTGMVEGTSIRWLLRVRCSDDRERMEWVAEGRATQHLSVREEPVDDVEPANGPARVLDEEWHIGYFRQGLYLNPDFRLAADTLDLEDGDLVETWPDAFGNGWQGEQSDETKRPTFKTARLNGMPGVRFEVGKRMPVNNMTRWEELTLGIVFTALADDPDWPDKYVIQSVPPRLEIWMPGGVVMNEKIRLSAQYGYTNTQLDSGAEDEGPIMAWLRVDYRNQTQKQWTKFGESASGFGAPGVFRRFDGGVIQLGSLFGNFTARMDVHDLVVFHRWLSNSEVAVWQGKLAHKWGITSTALPVSHPYKTDPPPW